MFNPFKKTKEEESTLKLTIEILARLESVTSKLEELSKKIEETAFKTSGENG